MRIGRGPECEIMLPERVVSREHAYIERQDDGYHLFDNASKNGTFVNGEAVTEGYLLQDGDEIQIALRFRLTFVDAGATAPLTMETRHWRRCLAMGCASDSTRRTVEIQGKVLDAAAVGGPIPPALHAGRGQRRCGEPGRCGRVVWPEAQSSGVTEQAIDALVRRLRERLAELDPEQRYIVTVRGHGFRFENRGRSVVIGDQILDIGYFY